MSKTLNDQTLALAGILQAVTLVQQAARRGQVDLDAMEVCLRSLLIMDAEYTEDVYGGAHNLQPGFRQIGNQLGNLAEHRDIELARYLLSLLHLERKLSKNRELLNQLTNGLEDVQRQLAHFPITHANIVANLADIYANTVSTLTPRIMVAGEHGHLNNPEVANKVRALLLAGIRSAVLWRQSGGGRLGLLFRRKAYLEESQRLLRSPLLQ